jgi:ribosomal protein S18 acetylase RimI-like enzyme
MGGKVIQGSFPSGGPRLPSPAPARLPPPIQAQTTARPPVPAFAGRHRPPTSAFAAGPPGPPVPAFTARPAAVQRHGAGGAFAVEAGQLGLASGGGRLLPDSVRGKMEAALGADFSAVRVHVGPQADRIGAIAFTIGSEIYFAPGRYQPDTPHGQQLLGHELAHVVQQRAGRVRNLLGSGLAVVQDHALEAEADRLGRQAAAHRVAVQAKMPPDAAQSLAAVRISPPMSAGHGTYRLNAGAGGRQVGSVMVHARERGAVEVTDLNVAEAQRGHGIGRMLVASAARAGQQFGKSKVTLAARDNGSGHLTRWYKDLGFAQVGINHRGYPQLEAPISRVLAGVAQRQSPLSRSGSAYTGFGHPGFPGASDRRGASRVQSRAVQRMDGGPQPTQKGWAPSRPPTGLQPPQQPPQQTAAPSGKVWERLTARYADPGLEELQLRLQFGRFLIGYLKERGVSVRVSGSSAALVYVNALDEHVKAPKDLDLDFKTTIDFTNGLTSLQTLENTRYKFFECGKKYQYSIVLDADEGEQNQYEMKVYLSHRTLLGKRIDLEYDCVNESNFTNETTLGAPVPDFEKYKDVAGFTRLVVNFMDRIRAKPEDQAEKNDRPRLIKMFQGKFPSENMRDRLAYCSFKILQYFSPAYRDEAKILLLEIIGAAFNQDVSRFVAERLRLGGTNFVATYGKGKSGI